MTVYFAVTIAEVAIRQTSLEAIRLAKQISRVWRVSGVYSNKGGTTTV